jgi:hypothetical protein
MPPTVRNLPNANCIISVLVLAEAPSAKSYTFIAYSPNSDDDADNSFGFGSSEVDADEQGMI